jgi:non-ribosomal peptide synthetase component F
VKSPPSHPSKFPSSTDTLFEVEERMDTLDI